RGLQACHRAAPGQGAGAGRHSRRAARPARGRGLPRRALCARPAGGGHEVTEATLAPVSATPDAGALMVVRGLESGFAAGPVLFGIDLDIGDSEVVAVIGSNGAGKST